MVRNTHQGRILPTQAIKGAVESRWNWRRNRGNFLKRLLKKKGVKRE